MALCLLMIMNRRIDERQAIIEEKEHNRRLAQEFKDDQAAGKTAAEPASKSGYWERKISVRPLIIFFACVVVFSAAGLVRERTRVRGAPSAGRPTNDESDEEPGA
jgi:hypothetical protein